MPKLNAVVADINAVDEGLRSFYVEQNGKYVLDVAASEGFALENVAGLKTALVTERNLKAELEQKAKEYETRFSAYEGLDPNAARDALRRLETITTLDPEKEAEKLADEKYKAKSKTLKEKYEADMEAIRTDATTKLTAAEAALQAKTQQIQSLLVDNAISTHLAKLNPVADLRDAVELLARQSIKTKEVDGRLVVQVVDANGQQRFKDVLNGVPMTVEDLLTEMRETRPSFFQADSKPGIGMGSQPNAPGGAGKAEPNPFAKGPTWNLTQQSLLLRNDPAKAARLRAAAAAL
jgi:hypothetical protein